MKKIVLVLAAVLTLGLGNVLAEEHNTNNVRTIKSPRFARPLVDIGQQETETKNFCHLLYIGETAVLPITARSSEAARLLEGKHLNAKKLKQLFFLGDEFDDEVKNKTFERITVYSGSNATSVAGRTGLEERRGQQF